MIALKDGRQGVGSADRDRRAAEVVTATKTRRDRVRAAETAWDRTMRRAERDGYPATVRAALADWDQTLNGGK